MSQPETPTSPEETPEIETPSTIEETPETPETPAPAPETPAPSEPDYKKKFSESTREAQILREQNRQKDARIEQLTKQPTPTELEQQLRTAYPEWDNMMPHEQRMARENFGLKRQVAGTEHTLAEIRADQMWEKDKKKVVKTFPALAGREDEFEEFALMPTHRNTPIDVLARAFLNDGSAPATPSPTPQPPRPGPERGSGGPKETPKPKKISLTEAAEIRKTNYKRWKELVDAGMIDDEGF